MSAMMMSTTLMVWKSARHDSTRDSVSTGCGAAAQRGGSTARSCRRLDANTDLNNARTGTRK